jgi:hypothetical protein
MGHPVPMPDRALPQEAAEAFRARPEDFVATRDALAKQLREDGREDDAAAVKALRKPTVVVWALNQLAVRAPKEIEALLEAGRELRAAQQAATSAARGADRLREATAARRAAVAPLLTVANEALDGASTAQTDAIRAALETASVDPEAGVHLSTGTFTPVPANAPGFGDVFGLASVPAGGDDAASARARHPAAPGPDLNALRRERDHAAKTAEQRRGTADRLATKLADQRIRLRALEEEHAAAEQAAMESATERKRAERALAKAEQKRSR